MKTLDLLGLKYLAVGFACLVIAMAVLRTLHLDEIAPGVVAAILLSVLVAFSHQIRQNQMPNA